jgi:predicted nucleotidyltransferase
MTRKDKRILDEFAAAIRKRFPEARVWAFGSRTTGRATRYSDLDVCVVVDRLDDATAEQISRIAWEVGFEHDRLVSPIPFSRREFESGPCAESGLVRTVLTEGVPV